MVVGEGISRLIVSGWAVGRRSAAGNNPVRLDQGIKNQDHGRSTELNGDRAKMPGIRIIRRSCAPIGLLAFAASAGPFAGRPAAAENAAEVVLPVTMDNSIVLVDRELGVNAGGAARIRIKGNQHLVALACDTAPIRGRRVVKAALVCHQGAEAISGVTISTIVVPWDEHASTALAAGREGIAGWGFPGGRFPAVCGGNSFSLVHRSRSEPRGGRYHWEVPPDMVACLALGIAHGLAIHEHDADYSRNPTIFSREQTGKEPVLVVEVADGPFEEAEPAAGVALAASGLDTAVLSVESPARGFAFEVTVDGHRLGQHNVPLVQPGTRQSILVRDLPEPLVARDRQRVEIVTLSRTGDRSRPAVFTGTLFTRQPATLARALAADTAGPPIRPVPAPARPSSAAAAATIVAIPICDRFDAAGQAVGELPAGYRDANPVFADGTVRLTAAAGEVVGFQMLLRGKGAVEIGRPFADRPWRVDLHVARRVSVAGRLVPDPLLPLPDRVALEPDVDTVVLVEVFVPFDERPGRAAGAVTVSDGRRLPVELEVLPWSLPRRVSFVCEMNSYGLPDRVEDYETLQRIAYDHRAHVNILHYSHRTAAPGARKSNLDMRLRSGRRMDNRRYDAIEPGATRAFWDDFAAAFGPVLDGSLFREGHRGPVPVPGFYLTFHESWPLNCRGFFNGDPDAYAAFAARPEYAGTFSAILADFGREAARRGWNEAGFQVYLNNKGTLHDPERSPWILDEPTSFWDYRALQFFGALTDRGRAETAGLRIDYRIDISRPEFCRGQLAGRRDLWVVSSAAFAAHRRLVTDRMAADGLVVWVYGTANPVGESSRMLQAWALDVWTAGGSGIVPWQTIDKTGRALSEPDQLGLFIFDRDAEGRVDIRHSLRLSAFREAQQLVEHLAILERRLGWSREHTAAFVRYHVGLDGAVRRSDADDAGTPHYAGLTAEACERLRGAAIALVRGSHAR